MPPKINGRDLQAGAQRALVFCLIILLMGGCATYQGKITKARDVLKTDPLQAAEMLAPLAQQEGKDQLVYLFDYGTALQIAGNYRESNKVLLDADRMSEIKDYTSITKEATSLLLNEEMVQYKGDDFEKVIVNAMLAINFASMGDLDGALVETRRLNEKLEHYRIDAKKKYEQNVFAVYLGGLIWESNKNWDSAYISYEKAYNLGLDTPTLREDLVRGAYNARRIEAAQKWERKFGVRPKPEWKDHSMGEIVLIYQQGWGPRKRPSPSWRRIPKLYPTSSYTRGAMMIVDDKWKVASEKVYSVETVAIKTLDDQYAPLIAKRVAGMVAKKAVSDRIGKENEALGALAYIVMHASDRADLRQWSTLPETFQIAKLRVKPGTYNVKVQGLGPGGNPSSEFMPVKQIQVRKGRKTFFTWRSLD